MLGNSSTTIDEHDCLENEQLNPPRNSHEAPPRGLRERRRRGSPLVTKLLWPGLHMTNIHTSRGTSFCAHILGSFDRTAQNMFLAGVPYVCFPTDGLSQKTSNVFSSVTPTFHQDLEGLHLTNIFRGIFHHNLTKEEDLGVTKS